MNTVEETRVESPFFWGWENMIEPTLSECGTVKVMIVGTTSFGVPPYYMVAWKVDGVPTTSYIGTDRTNLTWQVNQESGSRLVLTVVDSRGMMGGTTSNLHTVSDGTSGTSCLPPTPPKIDLTANASTSTVLETCEPLELRIAGGQKPYTVSITDLNAGLTNITLNDDDDVLTWPSKALPNNRFLVSVFDANGVWGTSTGLYVTDGPNPSDCAILATSRNSGDPDGQPSSRPSGSTSNDQHDPSFGSNPVHYVAIIVPIVIVGLLIGLACFVLRRRLRRNTYQPQPAIVPDTWLRPSSIIDRQPSITSRIKDYEQLSRSEDILLNSRRVVQHQDASDIQELPPPYSERLAQTSASTSGRPDTL